MAKKTGLGKELDELLTESEQRKQLTKKIKKTIAKRKEM